MEMKRKDLKLVVQLTVKCTIKAKNTFRVELFFIVSIDILRHSLLST